MKQQITIQQNMYQNDVKLVQIPQQNINQKMNNINQF